jgi:hypothetical protein
VPSQITTLGWVDEDPKLAKLRAALDRSVAEAQLPDSKVYAGILAHGSSLRYRAGTPARYRCWHAWVNLPWLTGPAYLAAGRNFLAHAAEIA